LNYESEHLKRIAEYERRIQAIYNEAVKQSALLGKRVSVFNKDKPFYFSDYPSVNKQVEDLIKWLYSGIHSVIINGIDSEWTLANSKNSELANRVFGDNIDKLTSELKRKYYKNNHDARDAFKLRKENGLNLSDRIWNYTNSFKEEIEMGLDIGLGEGKSASELSSELKRYLNNPDELFRRVRDKHGNLHLSSRAKAYHPGRGVYRSSYKNAMRLAGTETNMAYRHADYERSQQFDFVVGIEIVLSNNHTVNGKAFTDICDRLEGKYPKDFKFSGWHPKCRCYTKTILKTPEELATDVKEIIEGKAPLSRSSQRVVNMPKKFNIWMQENEERIKQAKTLPYFLRDNNKYSIFEHNTGIFERYYNGDSKNIIGYLREFEDIGERQVKETIALIAKNNPDYFPYGFKGVSISKRTDFYMGHGNFDSYDANNGRYIKKESTIYISSHDFDGFNPAVELRDALTAIKDYRPLTFKQEYAIESLWHEIRHASAKGWYSHHQRFIDKDIAYPGRTVAMETVNQFCARMTYEHLLKQLGAESRHKNEIMTRGLGYGTNVNNLNYLIEKLNLSQKQVFNHFKDLILTTPYEKIENELVKYIEYKRPNISRALLLSKGLSFSEEEYKVLVGKVIRGESF